MREITEKVSKKLPNGNVINYVRLKTGTCYHADTDHKLIEYLETYRERNTRIRFFYGDTETGLDWNEENDTIGTIGRSTGNIKIPILLKTANSSGGGAILDNCIVRLTVDKVTVWKHPLYYSKKFAIQETDVLRDGELFARFDTQKQAERFIEFMRGDRNSK